MSLHKSEGAFFVTLSPREAYTPEECGAILEYMMSSRYNKSLILIKEFGKKGDHEHLHAVWVLGTPARGDVLRKHLLKCASLHKDAKELKVEALRDTPAVFVAKYLRKEQRSEILHNDLIDLSSLPEIPDMIYDTMKGKRIVTPAEAPTLVIAYCKQNDLGVPTTLQDLYRTLVHMGSNDYLIHNVVKERKNILHCIRIYTDKPEGTDVWVSEFCETK